MRGGIRTCGREVGGLLCRFNIWVACGKQRSFTLHGPTGERLGTVTICAVLKPESDAFPAY